MLASLNEKSRADNKTSAQSDHHIQTLFEKLEAKMKFHFLPKFSRISQAAPVTADAVVAAAAAYAVVVVFVLNLLKAPL